MTYTTSQYMALHQLDRWYRKYNHQVIEISGVIGTGIEEVLKEFISLHEFDPREIMYLSLDQKFVLEMAYKRYHAYYLNGIIYKYTKIIDFNSLPVINPESKEVNYQIRKEVRKKLPDVKYKLMVVFDSVLLNKQTLKDLMSFGLPIILIRDPMLIPAADTFTYTRDPDIIMTDLDPALLKQPIVYFANKILKDEKINTGSYDTVSVVDNKHLNLYNFKSSDMIITLTDDMMNSVNHTYREKILNIKDTRQVINERVILCNSLYNHKLVNDDEKKIKIYLTKGLVGNISKCNRHALGTKYIPIDFRPDGYHASFEELYIDRFFMNDMGSTPSRQQVPDEILYVKYAYALSSVMARLSHWGKVTLLADSPDVSSEIYRSLLYSAITRCTNSLTLVI